jgi:glycosyltransferase involved in cell wall biosynthesis
MKKIDITYVFGTGRKSKFLDSAFSNEFFYGYDLFCNENLEVEIIELDEQRKKISTVGKFIYFMDRVLNKVSKLPFYMNEVMSYKTFRKLIKSKNIIFTNDRIGISLLPLLVIIKTIRRVNSVVIVMGMLNNDSGNKLILKLQSLFLRIFIRSNNYFIFLGNGEYSDAVTKYPEYKHKFVFLPFCINTDFWDGEEKYDSMDKEKTILFIGNDGNREYNKVIKIAELLPDLNFTFVTSQIKSQEINLMNVNLLEGNWNKSVFSDAEIKLIYKNSLLTILPLKNTLQPSGQSVALQSMSMGVPVVISNSIGFWDSDNFINNEHLLILENNNLDNWVQEIKNLVNNKEKLNNLSSAGEMLIKNNYSLDYFYFGLKKMLIDVDL